MTSLFMDHVLPDLPSDAFALRWPDVARVPGSRGDAVRAAVARRLFRHAVSRLPIRVQLPGAAPAGAGGDGSPLLRVHRPDAFFARIGAAGLIGFGEAFLAGDWDAGPGDAAGDRLVPLLEAFAAHLPALVPPALQRLRAVAVRHRPAVEENTPEGSRSNVSRHYDLSNELFATFLDPTLSYSSALFGPGEPADWDGLPAAQHRKINRLLDACAVGPGTRLLEIGTGWGELALRAAARGARVRSVTLSAEQLALARQRVAAAGVDDRVTLELRDYRDLHGEYDAVVSVEMVEAVGMAWWPTYFSVLRDRLAPGGLAGVQAITMPHERMLASRDTQTWITKYVFPGGMLPSVRAFRETAAGQGLVEAEAFGFGMHYAGTLALWRRRFAERAEDVGRLGFDPVFTRMWTFYLAWSEAGFRSRYLDVHQFVLRRPA